VRVPAPDGDETLVVTLDGDLTVADAAVWTVD